MPRKKTFIPEQALDKAMYIFWEKGFDNTSLPDLLTTMGISRQSMYDTFGDKRKLFIQVMDRYEDNMKEAMAQLLTSHDTSLDAIKGHFRSTLATINLQPKRKACLMANTAMELAFKDEVIISKVKNYMEMYMKAFLHALAVAQKNNEISKSVNIEALAKYLTTNLHGLGIMAKCGATEDDLNDIIGVTFAILEK
ncbi:hypothetical protein LCGC14_2267910 [marine sediment metagenome]|uniref:HTH tetR-type domain-containing protein n=1 Tax=marine sediment metagenome TaxID=412755 RepID=A0A0F9FST9_9ZZZZ|nr:MAG: HTH-type transcriptional repressor ComR [Candidatus Heimdallarchaeota archaeon LC_2]